MSTSLTALVGGCRSLIESNDDFWLAASLEDWSFEEGVRNKRFREYVETWRAAGLCGKLIEELEVGVNGMLARLIALQPGVLAASVRQNPDRGPDIEFALESGRQAFVQVKRFSECTLKKSYPHAAADIVKLDRLRGDSDRFLAVFFVQMPNYDYPSGRWYGRGYPKRQTVMRTIDSQFALVMEGICNPPSWPNDGPYMRNLAIPSDRVSEQLIRKRFTSVFMPSYPWQFDGAIHLREARVGFAIWQRTTPAAP